MQRSLPRVAVVVLNYNGLDDTVRCLESLAKARASDLLVILVDNGSDVDPEPAARRCFPELLVIKTGANRGYAGGNNAGIAAALSAGAEYVIILNNDTVVAPDLVTSLLQAFRDDPSLGIAGPVINYMDEPQRVMTDGVRFNPGPGPDFFTRVVVPVGEEADTPVTVDIVNGCCMMVDAEVFRTTGLFDELLFIVHEESDFCLRARRQGYRAAVVPRTLVWHKGSSSFDRSGRRLQRYYDTRNLCHLLVRHAGVPDGSRLWLPSVLQYVNYAYYRYALEREAHKAAAAEAVLEGLYDGLGGRTGPYDVRRRTGLWGLRLLFRARCSLAGSARPATVSA